MKINKTFILNLFILFLVTTSVVLISAGIKKEIIKNNEILSREEAVRMAERERNKISDEEVLQQGILKVLDLENAPKDDVARRILCDYVECDKVVWDASGHFSVDDIRAVRFDLNDDGVDEIIGYWHFYYPVGLDIYILQKTKKGYKNLYWTRGAAHYYPIIILNHKTNGWHDYAVILAKGDGKPTVVRYLDRY